MNRLSKISLVVVVAGIAVASQAVTFSNVTINSAPLSSGSSFSTIGNAISFFTPNAIVGDGQPLRFGTLNIQYDATSSVSMLANEVNVNLGAVTLGTGQVIFRELIFALDSAGNELPGGPIATSEYTFDATTGQTWSDRMVFSQPVAAFRAKKSFTLVAPDSQVLDLAAVGFVNQNVEVVPEPATMTALAVGALALLRRRSK